MIRSKLKAFLTLTTTRSKSPRCADRLQPHCRWLDLMCGWRHLTAFARCNQLDEIIKLVDTNNDGRISKEEFKEMVERYTFED